MCQHNLRKAILPAFCLTFGIVLSSAGILQAVDKPAARLTTNTPADLSVVPNRDQPDVETPRDSTQIRVLRRKIVLVNQYTA